MDKRDFRDLLIILGIITLALIFIFILLFIGSLSCEYANFKLDKSICDVYVENQIIYSGRCHFIDIDSVGENGNTKHLIIYKDALKLKPIKHIINENIQIKEQTNDNEI